MTAETLKARIVDVSPRDGLQNESSTVSVEAKVELIRGLIAAGAEEIEVGSFVSPKWVPQMASTDQVISATKSISNLVDISLVPNMRGLERAIEFGASRIAVFPAATETFSEKNLNASIEESLSRFSDVAQKALDGGMPVRGYVSVAFHCPFEGWVDPDAANQLVERLFDMGCYEVSICDTTGKATPGHLASVLEPALKKFGNDKIVAHFHDTYDQGLANALQAWNLGVTAFDASVGGLGGCPYSPGASGNIATENLVHMFNGLGVSTGMDIDALVMAAQAISANLGRPLKGGFYNKLASPAKAEM